MSQFPLSEVLGAAYGALLQAALGDLGAEPTRAVLAGPLDPTPRRPPLPSAMHASLSEAATRDERASSKALECVVCMEHKRCVLLRPCRHAVTCATCTLRLTACPVCRAPASHAEVVYL